MRSVHNKQQLNVTTLFSMDKTKYLHHEFSALFWIKWATSFLNSEDYQHSRFRGSLFFEFKTEARNVKISEYLNHWSIIHELAVNIIFQQNFTSFIGLWSIPIPRSPIFVQLHGLISWNPVSASLKLDHHIFSFCAPVLLPDLSIQHACFNISKAPCFVRT